LPAKSLDTASLVLILVIAVLLVGGYVTLAALGRDTAGYAIFLGGPAVTTVLGLVLNKRVSTVAAAVVDTQTHTTAVVAESVSGLDTHLNAQDQTLTEIHAGVIGDPVPPAPPASRLPGQRAGDDAASAPVSLFGPLRPRP
jgi:hypothetical protein